MYKRLLSLFLCLFLTLPLAIVSVSAMTDTQAGKTAAWVAEQVPSPQIASAGGEWSIMGLSRSRATVPSGYYDRYVSAVEKQVAACSGQLSNRKFTEYSRVILALTAIGRDPSNVSGYNLLIPLGDYERSVWQGVNGAIFALLALDSGNYAIPQNTKAITPATRELYVQNILSHECPGGGFSVSGSAPDSDVTAMALTALANYKDQSVVAGAISRGVSCLSAMQLTDGSFASSGISNCESTAQVLISLSTLGIPVSDSRFIKNGNSTAAALQLFSAENGSFSHTKGGSASVMATEQALCALAAASRAQSRQTAFYDMSDVCGAAFSDIAGHPCQAAIEILAKKNIMGGMGDGTFAPQATMTRAQFAAVLTRSLGLQSTSSGEFSDVPSTAWYASSVNAASTAGLIYGVGNGQFQPQGKITVRAAELTLNRTAVLCGLSDYMAGPMSDGSPISRAQLAQMLCTFLEKAGRL